MTSVEEGCCHANSVIILDARDNVGVAVVPLVANGIYSAIGSGLKVLARDSIDFGHKLALRDITKGGPIIKYGETIAYARADIVAGSHVHTHNMLNTIG